MVEELKDFSQCLHFCHLDQRERSKVSARRLLMFSFCVNKKAMNGMPDTHYGIHEEDFLEVINRLIGSSA
jgi:hypothetical protein